MDFARARLHAQRLSRHDLATPVDVVRAFGAVQAQDLPGGMWAVGARAGAGAGAGASGACTQADVEAAIARFDIVRTWPMRGTLHFVAASDVHWLLQHYTARVRKRAATRHKQLGLDDKTFAKAERVLTKAMAGRKILARPDVMSALNKGGVSPDGQRGIHIIGELAMRGVLCGGPRVGKQHGFFLLEEFVPKPPLSKLLDESEALLEMARRFFKSHGPATTRDFAWWLGIAQRDADAAVNRVDGLRSDRDTRTYFDEALGDMKTLAPPPRALLLPPWDEYTVGYTPEERYHVVDPRCGTHAKPMELLKPLVLVDGLIVGAWTRDKMTLWRKVTRDEQKAIDDARAAVSRFTGAERGASPRPTIRRG